MSDAADRLAQAIRDVVAEAVREALSATRPPPVTDTRPKATPRSPEAQTAEPPKLPFRPGNPEYDAIVNDPDVKASWEKLYPDEPFPPPPDRRLLSVPETAQLLGISRQTVYALIKGGELKKMKIGSRTLVPSDSLDEFIAERITPPA